MRRGWQPSSLSCAPATGGAGFQASSVLRPLPRTAHHAPQPRGRAVLSRPGGQGRGWQDAPNRAGRPARSAGRRPPGRRRRLTVLAGPAADFAANRVRAASALSTMAGLLTAHLTLEEQTAHIRFLESGIGMSCPRYGWLRRSGEPGSCLRRRARPPADRGSGARQSACRAPEPMKPVMLAG